MPMRHSPLSSSTIKREVSVTSYVSAKRAWCSSRLKNIVGKASLVISTPMPTPRVGISMLQHAMTVAAQSQPGKEIWHAVTRASNTSTLATSEPTALSTNTTRGRHLTTHTHTNTAPIRNDALPTRNLLLQAHEARVDIGSVMSILKILFEASSNRAKTNIHRRNIRAQRRLITNGSRTRA